MGTSGLLLAVRSLFNYAGMVLCRISVHGCWTFGIGILVCYDMGRTMFVLSLFQYVVLLSLFRCSAASLYRYYCLFSDSLIHVVDSFNPTRSVRQAME